MASIVPIVEGHSEASAVPDLLRRLCHREGRYDVQIRKAFRVKRHKVVKDKELERSLSFAVQTRGADAAIVLLDSDDDCPVQLASALRARAEAEVHIPVGVICAERELETWFLAAKESLRGKCGIRLNAQCVPDAERIRDAKRRLTQNMEGDRRYLEVADQQDLVHSLDLDLAEARSRSFRKLCDEVRRLLALL